MCVVRLKSFEVPMLPPQFPRCDFLRCLCIGDESSNVERKMTFFFNQIRNRLYIFCLFCYNFLFLFVLEYNVKLYKNLNKTLSF